MIGAARKQAVVTLVERKSGYAVLAKVRNRTSDLVSSAIITQLALLTQLVKTMTFVNWKEFSGHSRIDASLKSTTYFADLFTIWQRGPNENFNGLLRYYFPQEKTIINRN